MCPVELIPYPQCGEKSEGEQESVGLYLNITALEPKLGESGFPAAGLGSHVPSGDVKIAGHEYRNEPSYGYAGEHLEATPLSNPHVAPLADELEIAYALEGPLLPGLEGGSAPNPIVPGEAPARNWADPVQKRRPGGLRDGQFHRVTG